MILLQDMIDQGEIPSYKIFTHEPAKKRKRRHAKENCEAQEAEEYKNELGLTSGIVYTDYSRMKNVQSLISMHE